MKMSLFKKIARSNLFIVLAFTCLNPCPSIASDNSKPSVSCKKYLFILGLLAASTGGGLLYNHFSSKPDLNAEALPNSQELLPLLRAGQEIHFQSTEQAEKIAETLGVVQSAGFKALPSSKRLELLKIVLTQILKLPSSIRTNLKGKQVQVVLVVQSITEDKEFMETNRGQPGGGYRGWHEVKGVTSADGKRIVIAADGMKKSKDGVFSVVIHEIGHAYDKELKSSKFGNELEPFYRLSYSPEFIKAHDKTNWDLDDYFLRTNLHEAFAEGMALYFGSEKSRERLKKDWPAIHEYFEAHFKDDPSAR